MTKHKAVLELEIRYDLLLKRMRTRHAAELRHVEWHLAHARERSVVAHTRKQIARWRQEHEGRLAELEAAEALTSAPQSK